MLYADSGDLGEVVLSTPDGRDATAEVLQSTTPLIAEALLPDGDTNALRELVTGSRPEVPPDQIGGLDAQRVTGSHTQVRLADPNHDPTALWEQLEHGEPKPLPDAEAVQAALPGHGFECETTEGTQPTCQRVIGGLLVYTSASTQEAHAPAKWTLYGKPTHMDGSVTVAEAAAALASTARTAGLTDDQSSACRPRSRSCRWHG